MFQVLRARKYTEKQGLSDKVSFVKVDETEVKAVVDKVQLTQILLMLHVTIVWIVSTRMSSAPQSARIIEA